jgi:hypothetical protein
LLLFLANCLLGLHFNTKDRCSTFLRNVSEFRSHYTASQPRRDRRSLHNDGGQKIKSHDKSVSLQILSCGINFLQSISGYRNVSDDLPDYTASHSRSHTYSLPWKYQILYSKFSLFTKSLEENIQNIASYCGLPGLRNRVLLGGYKYFGET